MILFRFLDHFSWMLGSLIVVFTFILFTIIGIFIVRRSVDLKSLQAHHDVAGAIFTNLGVLYAVLLGFTVVDVQQRFDKISDIVQIEASYLSELYRNAEVFSKVDAEKIRTTMIAYTESVLQNEWSSLSRCQENLETTIKLNALWACYYDIKKLTPVQQIWYTQSINELNQLVSSRVARVLGSRESLTPEMWAFLILDGIAVVAFTWFFGPKSISIHLLMASIFAASTAFLLYLIYSLDTAFRGGIQITPEALHRTIEAMHLK